MASKKINKVYEVSFHILPTLDEKEAGKLAEQIKSTLAKNSEVISEEAPTEIDLAYSIRHSIRKDDGSYNVYDKAYFSTIKFRTDRSNISALHTLLQENESILRFLITDTVAENTRIGDVLPGVEKNESTDKKESSKKPERGTLKSDTK